MKNKNIDFLKIFRVVKKIIEVGKKYGVFEKIKKRIRDNQDLKAAGFSRFSKKKLEDIWGSGVEARLKDGSKVLINKYMTKNEIKALGPIKWFKKI